MSYIIKMDVAPQFEIHEDAETGFKSLFAAHNFEADVKLSTFDFEKVLDSPDMHSVQLDENKHIILQPIYLKYINHSCNPNVFFDLNKKEIRTLKQIKSGEEIVFFYPSTEWKMTEPFDCACGSDNCLNRIEGACNLSLSTFPEHRFSDFVMRKAMETVK
ncbi:MAG: SET domain-containing protein-lysine N-methyltransferase [Chitinophagales bacterium]|nr:SET domain-containing protein-lysine N-methyltransferase [Chitinophagales bacterium]